MLYTLDIGSVGIVVSSQILFCSPRIGGLFIRRIRDGGLVEIVLPWADEKIGVVVKRTGRDISKTGQIAGTINEKYGGIEKRLHGWRHFLANPYLFYENT